MKTHSLKPIPTKYAIMKRTILFFAVIFIFRITGFGQTNEEVIKTGNDRQTNKSDNPITYFITNINEISPVFSLDTLELVRTPVTMESPRLVLSNDYTFSYVYNKSKLITIRSVANGEYLDKTIDNSERIHGSWKTNDIHKAITFILADKSSVNYSVKEEGNFIYFIKIKP
jgi:hypothetical protein